MLKTTRPIAITTGDHRGIGPEVIAKGLSALHARIPFDSVVIFGAPELYRPFRALLPNRWRIWTEHDFRARSWPGPATHCLNFVVPDLSRKPSALRAAHACGKYIELAARGCMAGRFSAMVTGPIDKSELRRGGFRFDGHTEMLRKLCGARSVTMMMAGPKMRVSLVTTHVALREVSSKISREKIVRCIADTAGSLRRDFGIKKPRIAVLALNPHAGDNGLFGSEESRVIEPAIRFASRGHPKAHIHGPFPADGFFAQWQSRFSKEFDAVVCMYHDQGLIPVKLLDFENTVNVTLGLPILRTSVDHGIGLDIAGRNQASPASFRAALRLAREMAFKRSRIRATY
ncbi:MAG: 4-hydroxythreonine-4-phosphate dehydrogenase PdxA [Deltaproteobacteria bacterium]|nr:4-hydroxythreonine-4-phosphate dehydrogenase PdxA [Deltaproteobacteria bacterium]